MPATRTGRAAAISIGLSGVLLATAAGAAVAEDDTGAASEPVAVAFDFEADAQGWELLLADYPEGADPQYADAVVEWRPLPDGLEGNGLYMQAADRGEDLFMGWKIRLDGLEPLTEYLIEADLTLASSIPFAWLNERTSPAEVFVKLGAVGYEPMGVLDLDSWYRLNARKGQGIEGGDDAVVLGTVANPNLGEDVTDAETFALMELSTRDRLRDVSLTATTGEDGSLWLFMGTDSQYPGFTVLYYDAIEATLTPVTE